jgi:biopolymer transport protein ExbB/TolQ
MAVAVPTIKVLAGIVVALVLVTVYNFLGRAYRREIKRREAPEDE